MHREEPLEELDRLRLVHGVGSAEEEEELVEEYEQFDYCQSVMKDFWHALVKDAVSVIGCKLVD